MDKFLSREDCYYDFQGFDYDESKPFLTADEANIISKEATPEARIYQILNLIRVIAMSGGQTAQVSFKKTDDDEYILLVLRKLGYITKKSYQVKNAIEVSWGD